MLSRAARGTAAWMSSAETGASGADRNARFRAFREGAFNANFLRQGALERFWLSDLRRFYLFLHLLRQSGWMRGGKAGSFPLALVALQSKLSVARVSQLLDMAVATGDFHRARDPRDARQYVFEPSEQAIALFLRLVTDLHRDGPALIGATGARPGPLTLNGPDLRESWVTPMLRFLGALDLRDRGVGSLSFMLALFDLHLHSPLASSDFIRREAERLHVTCVTIRNLLRRAEERRWLRRERRMLSLSAEGTRRVHFAMDAFEGLLEEMLGLQRSLPLALPEAARIGDRLQDADLSTPWQREA
jgi:hypothetical protein